MLFSPLDILGRIHFLPALEFAVSVHPCLEGIAHEYYGRFKPTLDHEQEFIETDMERAPQQCVSVDGTFCVVLLILWYIVDVVYVTLSIYNLPMGFDIENTYVLRFERMTSKAAAYQPGRTMKEDVADLHEIVTTSVLVPRSRPAKAYSDRVSGTGVTAPRMVAGSAPSAASGVVARTRRAPLLEIQRAAAMRQPAHNQFVFADHRWR